MGGTLGGPHSGDWGGCATELLHKATLARLGYLVDLPNTQKQTQGSSQDEETEKHASDERTGQNSRKRTK